MGHYPLAFRMQSETGHISNLVFLEETIKIPAKHTDSPTFFARRCFSILAPPLFLAGILQEWAVSGGICLRHSAHLPRGLPDGTTKWTKSGKPWARSASGKRALASHFSLEKVMCETTAGIDNARMASQRDPRAQKTTAISGTKQHGGLTIKEWESSKRVSLLLFEISLRDTLVFSHLVSISLRHEVIAMTQSSVSSASPKIQGLIVSHLGAHEGGNAAGGRVLQEMVFGSWT